MKLRGSQQFSQAQDVKTTDIVNSPPKLVVFLPIIEGDEKIIHARAARSSSVYSAIIMPQNITLGTEQTKMLRPRFYLSKHISPWEWPTRTYFCRQREARR
ncbi:MAG: hypothetical protein II609_07330 [Muribaculaceae bacterium]|nr:hypothetical protein [Muribaculaceae bacterium]